jgi:ribosomal-protein-alanine N-acetyltransferase
MLVARSIAAGKRGRDRDANRRNSGDGKRARHGARNGSVSRGMPEKETRTSGLKLESERLTYRPVEPTDLDAFSGLVQDEHVRRYLMDGNVLPPSWSAAQIRDSQALFERLGVGLWLVHDRLTGELVGFCGFLVLPDVHARPELVYAMRERFTGRGLATEMARAAIAEARARAAFDDIIASVDDVNTVSVHVLEKLGFQRLGTRPGAFGNMLLFRLPR